MTVVVDASAMAELLIGSPPGAAVIDALADDTDWAVPEHFFLEVASALRGCFLGGLIDRSTLEDRITWLGRADVDVFATVPLLSRVTELASNATTYDAAYIALAEQLDAVIVTTDAKLSLIPGIRCTVRTLH